MIVLIYSTLIMIIYMTKKEFIMEKLSISELTSDELFEWYTNNKKEKKVK